MDYIYQINHFYLGKHNRFSNPTRMTGGKGINASRTILNLGSKVISFSLLGGVTGERIHHELQNENFNIEYLKLDKESRNAITIMHDEGTQTEIVEKGPYVDKNKEELIISSILDIIKNNKEINIVTINGSVNTKNKLFYSQLLKHLRVDIDKRLKILMDISKEQLKNVVYNSPYSPDFIKPNLLEFSNLIDKEISTKNEIIEYLSNINSFNIPYLLISCGDQGAIAQFNGVIYDINIPKINVINPTGSGDATVGGIAYAFDKKYNDKNIIRIAMASGVSNAMEPGVGVINKTNVNNIFKKIIIN